MLYNGVMNNSPLQQSGLDTSLCSPTEECLPFEKTLIKLTQQDYVELKWNASYWKTQHARAFARGSMLKEQLKQKDAVISNLKYRLKLTESDKLSTVSLQAQYDEAITKIEALKEGLKHKEAVICDLKQRLYGKKTEKGASKPDLNSAHSLNKPKRPRGQQKGSTGHGRAPLPNLPVVDEIIPLSETACGVCGLKYSSLSEETSDVIEIEVTAHTRRIKRQKCVKNCTCSPGAKIITAPAPPKLLARNPYGNSIWEELLLRKFSQGLPINRTLQDFKNLGVTIPPGSIAGGFQKIKPLFEPVYNALHQQQMTENRFHNDETRWEVYQQIEGKIGHRWYLWLTYSKSVVYYRIDPTRSADVPLNHFADLVSKLVIIICDRYSAYKKLARLNLAIILAFCWAHVRRDFLDFARSHPDLKDWGLDWADEISTLFHLNNQRVALWDKSVTLASQSLMFQEAHQVLGSALVAMRMRCNAVLLDDKMAQEHHENGMLTAAQRKILVSLQDHWKGLMVFYEYPEVKMDNNPAERLIRNPVVGRKGYYGSGSIWSAELAAMMFSIFQTLLLWNLNPRTWLKCYFEACAQNSGRPPEDLSEFLPWSMNETRRQQLSKQPSNDTS